MITKAISLCCALSFSALLISSAQPCLGSEVGAKGGEESVAESVDLWAKPALRLGFQSNAAQSSVNQAIGLFVSVTKLHTDKLIIATYEKLYLLNTKNNVLKELPPRGFSVGRHQLPNQPHYVPTGVYYSHWHRKLFVANYHANNIVAFDVDMANDEITFAYSISSERTISPENVFVSADGKYLVSANYDGNSVVLFEYQRGSWAERWSFELAQAHGVAIEGDYVFATGLVDRRLVKISIETGKAEKSVGSIGWEPRKAQFLWPTSVFPFDKGRVVVSDAHTGFVSIFNSDTLSYVTHFGGNGPSYRFFNMPYFAMADDESLIILSTFQKRVLILDKHSRVLIKHFTENPSDWSVFWHTRKELQSFGGGWDVYIWKDGPTLNLFGRTLRFGFGGFSSARLQHIESFLSGTSYLYFVDAIGLPHGFFVFSPMAAQAYVLTIEPPYLLIPVHIGMDVWRVGNRLIGPTGVLAQGEIYRQVAVATHCLDSRRHDRTILSGQDLYDCIEYFESAVRISATTKDQYAPGRLRNVFRSAAGKTVLVEFERCWESRCASEKLFPAIENYIEQFRKESIGDVDELFAILMISGYRS